MLFIGHVKNGPISYVDRYHANGAQRAWLRMRKVKAFYVLSEADNLVEGCKKMVPVSIKCQIKETETET